MQKGGVAHPPGGWRGAVIARRHVVVARGPVAVVAAAVVKAAVVATVVAAVAIAMEVVAAAVRLPVVTPARGCGFGVRNDLYPVRRSSESAVSELSGSPKSKRAATDCPQLAHSYRHLQ